MKLWQIMLLLLAPSLLWLARCVWLWHRENQRRKRMWYARQDTQESRAWKKRWKDHPMSGTWRNDE